MTGTGDCISLRAVTVRPLDVVVLVFPSVDDVVGGCSAFSRTAVFDASPSDPFVALSLGSLGSISKARLGSISDVSLCSCCVALAGALSTRSLVVTVVCSPFTFAASTVESALSVCNCSLIFSALSGSFFVLCCVLDSCLTTLLFFARGMLYSRLSISKIKKLVGLFRTVLVNPILSLTQVQFFIVIRSAIFAADHCYHSSVL